MKFTDGMTQAPEKRALLNVGAGLDIPTGSPIVGMRGETITNGGFSHMMGVVGVGNVGKSLILLYMLCALFTRYKEFMDGHIMDTELTFNIERLKGFIQTILCCSQEEADAFFEEVLELFGVLDHSTTSGNQWMVRIKDFIEARIKDKKIAIDTPFKGRDGNPIKAIKPHVGIVDALSTFVPDATAKMQDKAEIGDSSRNMEALTDARVKTQMLVELSVSAPRGNVYLGMSAHMGEQYQLDPYAPKVQKLAFLKQNVKMKNVPEKFTFLTTTLWWAFATKPLLDPNKQPLYPRDSTDKAKNDADLNEVSIVTLRNKYGPTGYIHTLLISQREGVLPHMTQFHYCMENNRFGIMGKDGNPNNLVNYYLELLPDVPLNRNNIRQKLDDNPRLRRAVEITSEMHQMYTLWDHVPKNLRCTAAELRSDLEKMGYDWNTLLDTRGWWTFNQYEHPIPFLSTYDLLRMRAGQYVPYWMEAAPVSTIAVAA